jgi:hypothetical protein
MLDFVKKIDKKATGVFAAGVLFGTAGIKILSSKDAKKAYTQVTAAVLRAKDCVLKVATNVQENAEDIYAEAQQINEDRASEDVVEDEEISAEETSAEENSTTEAKTDDVE